MAHEIESIAFANETPWHGLGKQVSNKMTPEQMLVAADLDWRVELKPCFANIGTEKKPQFIDIGRKALVRDKDNKVLTVTGENWKPLQNEDTLGFFKSYVKEGGASLETAGSLRGGKIVWALAALNDQFTLNGNDVVKGYLLLISPHEVGKTIQGFLTPTRVVCANTLKMALGAKRNEFRQNHLNDFDPAAAKKTIGLMRQQLGEFKLEAQTLAKMKMSELEGVKFLARFFQPMPEEVQPGSLPGASKVDDRAYTKFVEQLLTNTNEQSKALAGVIKSLHEAPGAQPETGWGVFNAVTHYCDHVAGREQDARLFNSWLGEKSRLKIEVKDALLDMVS